MSFDEFLEFDLATGYCDKVGQNKDSLTIDRIDSSKPYQLDNIRALTFSDNCSKKLESMSEPWEPIAKALHLVSGSEKNWRAFRKLAEESYHMAWLIEQQSLGNDPLILKVEPTDDNPF